MTVMNSRNRKFPKAEKAEAALTRLTERCQLYCSLLRLQESAANNNRPHAARAIRQRADEIRALIAASIARLRELASNAELQDSLEDTCCSDCYPTAHPLARRRVKALEQARWLAAETCLYQPGMPEPALS